VHHVEAARAALAEARHADHRIAAFSGRHYTPEPMARHMLAALAARLTPPTDRPLTVCDPFAGDGRLVCWLAAAVRDRHPRLPLEMELWDIDDGGLAAARSLAAGLEATLAPVRFTFRRVDSFSHAVRRPAAFDVVITNPPWENLKPDTRYTAEMTAEGRERYRAALRAADAYLADHYPESQPRRKFAGWGTNLARPGLQLATRLARDGGLVASVLPASVLADSVSGPLRRWIFESAEVFDVAYYPAEARAFGSADVASVTLVLRKTDAATGFRGRVTTYDAHLARTSTAPATVTRAELADDDHILPLSQGRIGFALRRRLAHLPRLRELEGRGPAGLWAGRELDETGIGRHLHDAEDGTFVRGRMIDRYALRTAARSRVHKPGWTPPPSTTAERLAWRDISRPTQKRRMIVTLIPAGLIAGNSLGVAHFQDRDPGRLRWLLGVMSSLVFEVQLRTLLNTGHVTLNSLREVRVPAYAEDGARPLVHAVETRLARGPDPIDEARIEALAARLYGLDEPTLAHVLAAFPKVTRDERDAIMKEFATS
jgi:Alw26I/Eco31I/Esp3I family type II restriction m6 adenine DNA methyltransferase